MKEIAFIQNLSSWEIILIFLVVLLFFGAKRLPELFRSFGKSVKEFKKATTEIEDDIRTAMEDAPAEKSQAPTEPTTETTVRDSAEARSTVSETQKAKEEKNQA